MTCVRRLAKQLAPALAAFHWTKAKRWAGAVCVVLTTSALCSSAQAGSFVSGTPLPGEDGGYYALPRAVLVLKISREKCDLKVEHDDKKSPIYLPDARARYRLSIDHSLLSTDELTVGAGADGLLTTVNGTSTDQTGEVLKKIVSIYSMLHGVRPPGIKSEGDEVDCEHDQSRDFSYSGIVDPTGTNAKQMEMVNEDLRRFGVTIETELLPSSTDTPTGQDSSDTFESPDCSEVVCFRPLRPYRVKVVQRSRGFPDQTIAVMAVVPDPKMVMGVRLDRQLFAKSNTSLTFVKGILTRYEHVQESEVLSTLKVSLDVARAILAVPGDLGRVRVTEMQSDTKLLVEQTNLVTSQINLITAQTDLIKAQQAAAAAAGGQQPPTPP